VQTRKPVVTLTTTLDAPGFGLPASSITDEILVHRAALAAEWAARQPIRKTLTGGKDHDLHRSR
jgi:hypothetical protein